ncbi:DEAD/DEAH box helicase family protein [Aestuariibaculum marinum]|uniref:DEAD/DEAH box helicase family protein n=1 Tax=Aestuariibaculum marinum TaxID=2683592 RepID=A0A8J6PUH2_9FLAO|nr:DEAD/DEAH box helicase family protein [Aestuariibaculum marinum]MBD0824434.1 DEAD/DEAH box helicase family protein [Aestuariibaculum marinum]
MTNFSFLQSEFPKLCNEATTAEKYVFTEPRFSALLSRSAMELAVLWLYENDPDLELPYDTKLGALLHNESFKNNLRQSMFRELDVIRLNGNNAAHGKRVNQYEALQSIKNLFRFLSFVSVYYSESNPEIPPFTETCIPDGQQANKTISQLKQQAQEIQDELDKVRDDFKKREEQWEANSLLKLQEDKKQEAVKQRKAKREEEIVHEKAIPELTSEAATRKLLIDLLLKEAGWDDLRKGRDLEFEVQGMPLSTNPTGKGYVDYVLWGKNGLPLAVVEAKRTLHSAEKGQHQAFLYANCLEAKYGQRPIIFYSNGFETSIWDDKFYPPRPVHGFYTQDELQLIIDRRKSRMDIRQFAVNKNIAGRPYQLEAVQRVSETLVTDLNGELRGRNRNALLVMATGSGKTRTSAAIVDMFTKCNWAKRILFLADRNALVTQAKNAFKQHLPDLSAIDLTKESEDNGTRLVFSTYPTIMNRIDGLKNENGRFYGVGHFDVIIIDEAHRSVYQKYRSIFEYFDALVIGLTATPKKDIDRNTYSLFKIEDDHPTFSYELNQAVADNYLKPPKAIKVPIKFPGEGITYAELSDEDKARFEELFGDPTTGEVRVDRIDKSKINQWLFNKDTVDKVLDFLMTNGIKVSGGDKLGKTIIFAKNHKHAKFIEKRFNKNYPEYGGTFLSVIDNYADKAQDLLEKFCDDKEELEPQIAVSVDMMDTGVDAPRVVNLVFFKEVKSYSKYWQMIGRGTRLRPDLFGPGEDKECFLIFDFCENFEFFGDNPEGYTTVTGKSVSVKIFETRLEYIMAVRDKEDATDDEEQTMLEFTNTLHQQVAHLDESRYQVRKVWRMVKDFKNRNRWNDLNKSDVKNLINEIAPVISIKDDEDEKAKRFDLLVLNLQLAILLGAKAQESYVHKIYDIARNLNKKRNIPEVARKKDLIQNILKEEFWQSITHTRLDELREDIRGLVKYLDKENQETVYTNFEDVLNLDGVQEVDIMPSYTGMKSYKERVEAIINKNRNHLVINKLYKNIPVTMAEVKKLEEFLFNEGIGTREEFEKEYGQEPLTRFIRKIVGLDIETANTLFSEFIQSGNLNANQITFINKIISYLNKNGILDKTLLTKPPFNEHNEKGILGIFPNTENVVKIISIIDQINNNVNAS